MRLFRRRAFVLLWSVLLPAAGALATLRFLIPSRKDGGSTGAFAFLAAVGDEHPVILGSVLFLSFFAVARYWLRRLRDRFGAPAPPPTSSIAGAREIIRFAVWLVALASIALVVRGTVAEIHRVVGVSMAPTLNGGDRLLVNKLAYGVRLPFSRRALRATSPRRGDVVVFPSDGRAGGDGGPRSLVKRVIGLPGDVIAFNNGSPIVNGWVVPSCDAGSFLSVVGTSVVRGRLAVEVLDDRAYLTIRTPLDETRFTGFKVPPGELFVLGDHRGVSIDSRAWNQGRGGGVRIDSVEGRVSRLASGAFSDGRLDLHRLFGALAPEVRDPNVDLRKVEARIAACLVHPPRSSRPPAAPP